MRVFILACLAAAIGTASAVPYKIPEPSVGVCTNDRVFDELSEKLGDGTLYTEQDLLASLDFVQECEALRRQGRRALQ